MLFDFIFENETSDDIFGQFLFAPSRDDAPRPKEKNTKEEDNFLRALKLYYINNDKTGLDRLAPLLLNLISQGKYKDLLDPTHYKICYRLLVLNAESLSKIYKTTPEIIKKYDASFSKHGTLVSVGSKVSGWTIQPEMLIDMSEKIHANDFQNDYIVIFKAEINKSNFFGNPDILSGIVTGGFQEEKEVLAFGNIDYLSSVFVKINNNLSKAIQIAINGIKKV